MVLPLVILSSSCFVYSIPRASTLKLYRWFWLAMSVVACRGFKSWTSDGMKIGGIWHRSALHGVISCRVFLVEYAVKSSNCCFRIVPNSYGHSTNKCNVMLRFFTCYIFRNK